MNLYKNYFPIDKNYDSYQEIEGLREREFGGLEVRKLACIQEARQGFFASRVVSPSENIQSLILSDAQVKRLICGSVATFKITILNRCPFWKKFQSVLRATSVNQKKLELFSVNLKKC